MSPASFCVLSAAFFFMLAGMLEPNVKLAAAYYGLAFANLWFSLL